MRRSVIVHENGDLTVLDATTETGDRRLKVGTPDWIAEAAYLLRNGLLPSTIHNDDGSVTAL